MKHNILKKSLIALTVFALTGLMVQADIVDIRTAREWPSKWTYRTTREKARSIKPFKCHTPVLRQQFQVLRQQFQYGYKKPTPWEWPSKWTYRITREKAKSIKPFKCHTPVPQPYEYP